MIKNVLAPLGLSAAMSAIDGSVQKNGSVQKKIHGSGHNTTLIITNDEIEDFLKIVKCLEDSGLLLEGVGETIKIETKEQKEDFLVSY